MAIFKIGMSLLKQSELNTIIDFKIKIQTI